VTRNGRNMPLSSKEFALLELFMMNPDRILTRQALLEHVWDMNFDPRSNVIESFVRLLRIKIEKGFPTKLIHTVRGSGYIFARKKP
jgi:DNA-binding response OmpR family regulator